VGEAQERSSRSTPQMSFLWQEVERPPGVRRAAREITACLGKVGASSGNRRRESSKLLFVHNDHLG
jgi:hypothetical protein